MNHTVTSQLCDIEGYALHSVVINSHFRSTILMVHGLSGSYKGLLGLARQFGDYRVVLIDLPGHGESEDLVGEYSIERLSRMLNKFIEKMPQLPEVIIAHSYGTLLCMQGSVDRPLLYDKLVLCNPIEYSPKEAKLVYRVIYRLVATLPMPIGRRLAYSRRVSHLIGDNMLRTKNRRLRAQLKESGYRDKIRVDVHTGLQLMDDGRKFETYHVAAQLKVKTLAIIGSEDRMDDENLKESLLENPAIEVRTIVGGGHLIPLESPRRTANLIRSWLDR